MRWYYETLMTIIDTQSLRYEDPAARLAQVLNAAGSDKKTDVAELLWGPKAPSTSVTKTRPPADGADAPSIRVEGERRRRAAH